MVETPPLVVNRYKNNSHSTEWRHKNIHRLQFPLLRCRISDVREEQMRALHHAAGEICVRAVKVMKSRE